MAKTAKSSKSSTTRSKKTKPKPVPAVRYLRYEIPLGAANTEVSFHCDLARDLSAINRRLYRQGRNYHIKSVSFLSRNTPNNGNYVQLCTVPDGWVSRNAWRRGFDAYQQMHKNVPDIASMRGKWADFKVYMDEDGATGAVSLLTPTDSAGLPVNLGEWVHSYFVAPTAAAGVSDSYTGHMMGPHAGSAPNYTSCGLIKSYGDSRPTSNSSPLVQNDASDDPLLNLFDFGDTKNDLIDDIESHNDFPPYDINNYPGDDANCSQPIVVKQTALSDGKASVGGFNALCGLLEVEALSSVTDDTITMIVELKEGNYRGIAAEVI